MFKFFKKKPNKKSQFENLPIFEQGKVLIEEIIRANDVLSNRQYDNVYIKTLEDLINKRKIFISNYISKFGESANQFIIFFNSIFTATPEISMFPMDDDELNSLYVVLQAFTDAISKKLPHANIFETNEQAIKNNFHNIFTDFGMNPLLLSEFYIPYEYDNKDLSKRIADIMIVLENPLLEDYHKQTLLSELSKLQKQQLKYIVIKQQTPSRLASFYTPNVYGTIKKSLNPFNPRTVPFKLKTKMKGGVSFNIPISESTVGSTSGSAVGSTSGVNMSRKGKEPAEPGIDRRTIRITDPSELHSDVRNNMTFTYDRETIQISPKELQHIIDMETDDRIKKRLSELYRNTLPPMPPIPDNRFNKRVSDLYRNTLPPLPSMPSGIGSELVLTDNNISKSDFDLLKKKIHIDPTPLKSPYTPTSSSTSKDSETSRTIYTPYTKSIILTHDDIISLFGDPKERTFSALVYSFLNGEKLQKRQPAIRKTNPNYNEWKKNDDYYLLSFEARKYANKLKKSAEQKKKEEEELAKRAKEQKTNRGKNKSAFGQFS